MYIYLILVTCLFINNFLKSYFDLFKKEIYCFKNKSFLNF